MNDNTAPPMHPETRTLRFGRLLCWGIGVIVILFAAVLELSWPQQVVLGLVVVLIAIWIDRSTTSYLVTLTLMLLSMFATLRYAFWRISKAIAFFAVPGAKWTALDAFFVWLLVGAEMYAFAILFLGYLQTLWPLRRSPVPLPDDTALWPTVDVLIPTYNEPLSVVRFTVLAALNMDWPPAKLRVFLLDDGNRPEFQAFAADADVAYLTRDDNRHAKAGNINAALCRTDSPFVVIFDSDHVPTRSFLQMTMGWFLRDTKLGMLQTPHHFYSPDPFERNLGQFRVIPNEGELFYGVVQDGNDFWNASFFCGSCAVLRRKALDEIGGIAVETVTEDAHTSLRLQMKRWNTAYINIPQAAGLATERLSAHVRQRIRWARGMVQILRIENPLFARGLSAAQRLCYFNAMSHFLYALPRLIFLTAPLIYLIFGYTNVPGYWAAILAYAAPHLVLSSLANSRIQGQHRHSFWNEIYETVLSPYILFPTLLALINPKLGAFNVTSKGGVVTRRYFDAQIAQPFLVILLFNFIGILMAIPRYFYFPIPLLRQLYDGVHPGTIVINLVWTAFNLVILGVATGVAWESQQRRQAVRMAVQLPTDLVLADGTILAGVTADLSSGGAMIDFASEAFRGIEGQSVRIVLPVLDRFESLPATVVNATGTTVRVRFAGLSLPEYEALTSVLYGRADRWLGWGEAREADRPLTSLGTIFQLSIHGFAESVRGTLRAWKPRRERLANGGIVALSLLLLCLSYANGGAQTRPNPNPGGFDSQLTLQQMNVPDTLILHGMDSVHSVYFSVPQTEIVKSARLHLRYHFSPALIPELSHLNVSINGTLFASLPVARPQGKLGQAVKPTAVDMASSSENSTLREADLVLPPDMLVHNNELAFQFVGHYTLRCEDPAYSALWARIDNDSTLELAGRTLPLPNDLKSLPLPFYDPTVTLHPIFPIAFASPTPTLRAVQAAGVVASYLGLLPADYRAVRFPTTFGTIPMGNAIVLAERADDLPAELKPKGGSGPTISLRTNPSDPDGKVLVLAGDDADQLLMAARALSLQRDLLQGELIRIPVDGFRLPAPRQADDAPRWMSTTRSAQLGDVTQTGDLQGDGSVPMSAYVRLPPDLYYGTLQNLSFHVNYRYNGLPLANESSLQFFLNGGYASSTPMPHTEKSSVNIATVVPFPVVNLRPFSNSLMMHFIFQIAKKGECEDTAPTNLQGAVLKDSYLDLSGIPHMAVLPNLELFANAGYPFTRKADLSETAVVLSDAPSTAEVEVFLTLMGHFGAQTGYPVLNVEVTNSQGLRQDGHKDYLVLGTVADQPALSRLNASLPVRLDLTGVHIQDTQGFFTLSQHAWWRVQSSDRLESGQLQTEGGLPDALIEGLEWPRGSSRSLVLIAFRDTSVVPGFLSVFLRDAQSSDIAQSVSVLHGDHFVSYRIGTEVYRVGSLSWLMQVSQFFAVFPWLLVLLLLLCCAVLAILLRAALRRHAKTRLQTP